MPTQDERMRAFLGRYGEGKRTFIAGADACAYADARDGVDGCDWLFDDPGGGAGASPTSR
jgi:hypothetical protein